MARSIIFIVNLKPISFKVNDILSGGGGGGGGGGPFDDGLWHDAAYFANDDGLWHDTSYFSGDDGLWHDLAYF